MPEPAGLPIELSPPTTAAGSLVADGPLAKLIGLGLVTFDREINSAPAARSFKLFGHSVVAFPQTSGSDPPSVIHGGLQQFAELAYVDGLLKTAQQMKPAHRELP